MSGVAALKLDRIASAPSVVAACASMMGVSIAPGLMALTRMPRRPRAHKRTNTGLGCAVSGVAWNALERGNGGNQDDGAAVAEKRKSLLDAEEKPTHVGAEGLVKILFRRVESGCGSMNPALATRMSIFPFSCLILS